MEQLALPMILGGAGLSAWSTVQGGKEAYKKGKLQQELFEGEAQAEVMAGTEAARIKRKEGRRLTASQIAAISASGGGLVGSNLVVMAESARNVEMDALTIERNAQMRAKALRMRGSLAKYEGAVAKRNAYLRAAAGLLGTAGRTYLMYKSSQPEKKKKKTEIRTGGAKGSAGQFSSYTPMSSGSGYGMFK